LLTIGFFVYFIFLQKYAMSFFEKYYPIFLAFFSFLYSVYLWFTGNQLEGIYVGLWPVTILAFAIAIRQRRNDDKNTGQ
tara:strand:- start:672 stop:908 length:237 start_codon:yes stop_codon:yes gene_type:complete